MSTLKSNTVVRGTYLKWRGEPVVVADKEIFAPGKGSAVSRLKLKNLVTGKVLKEVLKTTEMVEEIEVNRRKVQYSYMSGQSVVFMDMRTFEQFEVDEQVMGEDKRFLKEGVDYDLVIWEGKTLSVELPKKMTFKVVEAEDSVKGNTVTAADKGAKLDNGLVVKVPLFIKAGEEIVVSTEDGGYVSRKN